MKYIYNHFIFKINIVILNIDFNIIVKIFYIFYS